MSPTLPYRAMSAMALCLAIVAPLTAQTSLTMTLGGAFDSFRPTTSGAESRRNLAGSVNIENAFAAGRGRLSYGLDAGSYDSPGDWTYQLHDASATYRVWGTDTSARKVFLTGSLTGRRNGDAWASADYTAAEAGVNVELHPRDGMTLRSGYRADFRRFGDLSALSQSEHRGFASIISSFQTRTTLIVEGQVGAKQYDGIVYDESTTGVMLDTIPTSVRGRGYGASIGPGIRYTTVAHTTSSSRQGTAGMVSVMGRLAQSLTDRTGVRLEASARRTFGSVPPVLVTTPVGFFEDGVYDDPFASNGLFLEAGIKHVFPGAAEVAVTGWWSNKDYTSATALDVAGLPVSGSPLRSDKVSLGTVTWTRPVFANQTGAFALSTELGYRFTRHRSTDAHYNYTSHAVSAGMSVGY